MTPFKLIEYSASCWFMLHGYITIYGQQNIKFPLLCSQDPTADTS